MLSIQEIVDKTEKQRTQIEYTMDHGGRFHPDIETPEHTACSILDGLSAADRVLVKQALRNIPLREFLAKSGSTGITGAAYLVPDKIHDELVFYAKQTDLAPLIGRVVTGWNGGDLIVNIVGKDSYKVKPFSSGATIQSETVESKKATLAPLSFGINTAVTEDLVEDAAYDMVAYHVEQAAKSMGDYSTDLVLGVLKAPPDGWGTAGSGTSATTDTTIWSELVAGIKDVEQSRWNPNTLLLTHESWLHSVEGTMGAETAGGSAGDFWQPTETPVQATGIAEGFDMKAHTLDIKFSSSPQLHDATDAVDAAFTTCVSIIFDRNNSILTGRKRWMQISNYVNPVRDLANAVITARQDSVSLYKDAVYTLTEST